MGKQVKRGNQAKKRTQTLSGRERQTVSGTWETKVPGLPNSTLPTRAAEQHNTQRVAKNPRGRRGRGDHRLRLSLTLLLSTAGTWTFLSVWAPAPR